MKLLEREGGLVSPDTWDVLEKLRFEVAAKLPKHRLIVKIPKETSRTGMPRERSLVPAGREVELTLLDEQGKPSLPKLWGLAIPLGWMPWDRYPEDTPTQTVWHYVGVWSILMDHLVGAGRGEAAWPSVCAAAQCESGTWEGDHREERRIQSLLHLMGTHPGPVDGVIGPLTQGVLRSMGFGSMPLKTVLIRLEASTPVHTRNFPKSMQGKWTLEGAQFAVHTFGLIRARRELKGASVDIRGPGRIVIDITGAKNDAPVP